MTPDWMAADVEDAVAIFSRVIRRQQAEGALVDGELVEDWPELERAA